MKNLIASLVIVSLLFSGCTSNTDSDQVIEETVAEAVEEDHAIEELESDNGNKWKVNEEMKPYVIDAEKLLAEFSSEEIEDYIQLGKDLHDQNNALIQSCTMDGKSHDELHKWLHPHLELTAELGKIESKEQAADLVNKLRSSFEVYHNFFE